MERTAELPWADDPLAAARAVAGAIPLRIAESNLDSLDPTALRIVGAVAEAWNRLADVQINPSSLTDVLTLLTRTVLEERRPAHVSSFRGARAAPVFRPTAAHPRAYEGTGARPPKTPAPRRFDLRSVALDPRACRALFAEFRDEADAAVQLTPAHLRTRASSVAGDGADVSGWDGMALPRAFRVLAWPHLRWVTGDPVGPILGALRRLDRQDDQPFVAIMAWWLATGQARDGLAWLHAALELPPDVADVVLYVLAELRARNVPVDVIPIADLALTANGDRAQLAYELWALIDAHRRHVDAELFLPGLELSRRQKVRTYLGNDVPAEIVPSKGLAELAAAGYGAENFAVSLWQAVAPHRGLANAVLVQPWGALPRDVADEVQNALAWGWPEDAVHADSLASWWRVELPTIMAVLTDAPADYQEKIARAVKQAVFLWKPAVLIARWPQLLRLIQRLGCAPFQRACDGFVAWNSVIEYCPLDLIDEVVCAPDATWRHFEKRVRVPTVADLVSRGMDALGQEDGRLVALAFLEHTRQLLEVSRVIGALSSASAASCVRSAGRHEDVREWLHAISTTVADELIRQVPADLAAPGVEHALLLQRAIDTNRRALRRFLRAHFHGRQDYVVAHPLSQRWMGAHRDLPLGRWLRGLRDEVVVDGVALTLDFEADPLEVLKLGTYVGSCLSIRGICDYSAAAVVLDINKQVVYARNSKGSVVARQLIAMSDEGTLVPFTVYPHAASPAVRRCFADYDRRLADHLGVSVLESTDTEYTISNVISTSWWNDGPWTARESEGRKAASASAR